MSYYARDGLDVEDQKMKRIIHDVWGVTPRLKIGKKYTLKQMVDIAHPGWWENNLKPYDARSAGVTFINLVNEGWFPELVAKVNYNTSNQFIRRK